MTPEEAIAQLEQIRDEALGAVGAARDAAAVREREIEHLGRKSALAGVTAALGALPEEDRRRVGRAANEVRRALEAAVAERLAAVEASEQAARLASERLDVTLPGRRPEAGHPHPISLVIDDIIDVFLGLGFVVVEGPEVETGYYNFEALNFPPEHPARSGHDSFYIEDGGDGAALFRTHNSPVQIRVMEATPPPIYVVVPGRCARRDVPDPKHLSVLHQIEGLAVDEGMSFADLKGTLEAFARAMFGARQRVSLTPDYFPFTEPSAQVSVLCFVCEGSGCRTCRGEGWIEIMGAGMVHPNVFRAVGYDPETTGFAFGMGAERVAMLRYGISDIRWLYENDLRFLGAF